MKYIFTCLTLLSSLGLYAQSVQMPFNPDYDGDNVVATTDFLAVLPLFGSTMVDTSFTCDYQGTELEALIGGIIAGNLVLDSVYVEYLLVDSVLTYSPECPDPFIVETVLDRSYMMTSFYNQINTSGYVVAFTNYLNYYREVFLGYDFGEGSFEVFIQDTEIGPFFSFSNYASWNSISPNCCTSAVNLPFPENWMLDEDGIQVDWDPYSWVTNCEHFRLIPYWHEAE